ALGIVREQLRAGQIEELQAAIQARDRLNGPGPADVQAGPLAGRPAIVRGQVLAELGHVGELRGIDGVQRHPAQDKHDDDQEDDEKRSHWSSSVLNTSPKRKRGNLPLAYASG